MLKNIRKYSKLHSSRKLTNFMELLGNGYGSKIMHLVIKLKKLKDGLLRTKFMF